MWLLSLRMRMLIDLWRRYLHVLLLLLLLLLLLEM